MTNDSDSNHSNQTGPSEPSIYGSPEQSGSTSSQEPGLAHEVKPADESTSSHLISAPSETGGWKGKLRGWSTAIESKTGTIRKKMQEGFKRQDFEPQVLIERANKFFQGHHAGTYGKILTLLVCTYFLADIVAIIAGRFIPEPPPSFGSRNAPSARHEKRIEDYNVIFSRNLFNLPIPGEEKNAPNGKAEGCPTCPPEKTTLPLNLIGTLILQDPHRSIATIEDKSAGSVYPVRVDDEIPSKVKILSIEPRRVIFLNLNDNRREYIELPEDAVTSGPRVSIRPVRSAGGGGVTQVSPTQYNISRAAVDSALSDISNVLTQARAVPNIENGVPNGYKLFQIVPNSIYAQLGLKDGDTIQGLNGQPINDPGKAFEMLNELKNQNTKHLELQVKRDGKAATYSYDIN